MRIYIEGNDAGNKIKHSYHLFDRFDKDNSITSMARTTGYTCTAVANLMLEGMFNSPGINPPEFVGKVDGHLQFILEYLKERNIIYQLKTQSE